MSLYNLGALRPTWAASALALITTLLLVSCSADVADPGEDDDWNLSQSFSEISVPGAWSPPPHVRVAAGRQLVGYFAAGAWNGGRSCSGTIHQPGPINPL